MRESEIPGSATNGVRAVTGRRTERLAERNRPLHLLGAASASSLVRISVVNPLSSYDWDTQTASLPGSSIFHKAAWARVLRDSYGFTPTYFLCHEGTQLRAILPMMEVSSWLTGKRGVSLPFTDGCEPQISDPAIINRLREALKTHASSRHWKYWELRGGQSIHPEATPSVSYYEHTLDLTQSENQLRDKVDSSNRRAIRKAEKYDVTVTRDNTLAAIRTYYDLHCVTRKRHGHPPQPFQFFAQIHAHVVSHGLGHVFTARVGGVPVAASIFFRDGEHANYRFGASDDRYQEFRANNLLMWTAIRWCRDQGARRLHFGRTSLENNGLRRFKMSWGSEENTISYFRIAAKTGRSLPVRDDARGFHTRIFRALPPALARRVGNAMYRHIG